MQSARNTPPLRAVRGGLASQEIQAVLPENERAADSLGAALTRVFHALTPGLSLREARVPTGAPRLGIAQPAVAAAPANIVRVRSFGPLMKTRLPWLDLAIVSTDASAADNPFDQRATFVDESSVELACEYALRFGRPSVTLLASPSAGEDERIALDELVNIATTRYPALEITAMSASEAAAALASGDASLDVVVTIPSFGSILAEVAASLSCAATLATEMRFSEDGVAIGRASTAVEADDAGSAVLLLAAADLCRWLGHHDAAGRLLDGWRRTIEFGMHTNEFGLQSPCSRELDAKEFADAVLERLGERPRTALPGHKDGASRPPRTRPVLTVVGSDQT